MYCYELICIVFAHISGGKGIKGDEGLQGLPGEPGPDGDVGLDGPIGNQGIGGDPGPIGRQGVKGDAGDEGLSGPQGIKGEKGEYRYKDKEPFVFGAFRCCSTDLFAEFQTTCLNPLIWITNGWITSPPNPPTHRHWRNIQALE